MFFRQALCCSVNHRQWCAKFMRYSGHEFRMQPIGFSGDVQGFAQRGLGLGELIDPEEVIELNKYYDDDLWDDGLTESATSAPT